MTVTRTITYTETDVRRVYTRLQADLHMIAQSTGMWEQVYVEKLIFDMTILAITGYLVRISVYLYDANGRLVQAETYTPSTDASSWVAQHPSCRWPRTPNGRVELQWSHTDAYGKLSSDDRVALQRRLGLKLSWTSASAPDMSGLTKTEERTYASNGYGLRRESFR